MYEKPAIVVAVTRTGRESERERAVETEDEGKRKCDGVMGVRREGTEDTGKG